MAGLVPGVTSNLQRIKDLDGRDKPGHDEVVRQMMTKLT
jgi:hypothetical protein